MSTEDLTLINVSGRSIGIVGFKSALNDLGPILAQAPDGGRDEHADFCFLDGAELPPQVGDNLVIPVFPIFPFHIASWPYTNMRYLNSGCNWVRMHKEVSLSVGLKLSPFHGVYCREDDALAIADLHLGYEASLQAEHVAIPRFQLLPILE